MQAITAQKLKENLQPKVKKKRRRKKHQKQPQTTIKTIPKTASKTPSKPPKASEVKPKIKFSPRRRAYIRAHVSRFYQTNKHILRNPLVVNRSLNPNKRAWDKRHGIKTVILKNRKYYQNLRKKLNRRLKNKKNKEFIINRIIKRVRYIDRLSRAIRIRPHSILALQQTHNNVFLTVMSGYIARIEKNKKKNDKTNKE